ncbi:hypothetical protein GCM10011581_00210 [Saccharopolyspora subtropica]|uniref:Small secreted protein n=1 Tax=Saccharopolyspora thermophila TaxID=89367 RepID=A0A917N620_9PSEU|nr:hypothetical protein [Saccharopolyspora subtropica]GGI67369.1 hypothetical protein GCM10011581_00210 [Saccharopolyspora subtropica]
MKLRSTSIAALVAVPLALAGCAAGPAPAQAPRPTGPSPEGVAWTGRMCGLVTGFTQAQQTLPAVDRTNTATARRTVIERLDAAARSADDTVRGLQGLGPSPIGGADQVNTGFQQSFTQLRDLLTAARGRADQVDPTDKQRFQSGMAAVQDELNKSGKLDFRDELTQLEQNKELKAAAARAPECRPFFSQPPQPPQPPR